MAGRLAVPVIDHRRERGRFATPGRSRHQHQTPALQRQALQDLRQAERIDVGNLRYDPPEHHPGGAALKVDVGAEPAEALHQVAQVHLAIPRKQFAISRRKNLLGQLDDLFRRQRGGAGRLGLAGDASHRRTGGL